MSGRLKILNNENYLIRLNEETGDIELELEDDSNTDAILQNLLCKGDFSINDAQTNDVLIGKEDVDEANVVYANTTSEGVSVYLDIKFNKEGKRKLSEVSRNYLKPEESEENDNSENEEESKENEKKVKLMIEGEELFSTYFGEEMDTGELPITLGTSTDAKTLQEYVKQAEIYSALINNDDLPIEYTIRASQMVNGNLYEDVNNLVIALICISGIIMIFLIIKFKINGTFGALSIIAGVGILSLIIRYANISLSLNSIVAIGITLFLDVYLICKMLSNIKNEEKFEDVKKISNRIFLEQIEVVIICLIVAVVFTFTQKVMVSTLGMVLFYGIISIIISNLIFLRTMILAKYSDK